MTRVGGISLRGVKPWYYPDEFSYFKRLTKGACLIVGRKTHETIPDGITNRITIVLTQKLRVSTKPDILYASDPIDALRICRQYSGTHPNVMVMGGNSIYLLYHRLGLITNYYVTEIHSHHDCDTFLESELLTFIYGSERQSVCSTEDLTFYHIKRKNEVERSWLDILKRLTTAPIQPSRNGNVHALFGLGMKYDLCIDPDGDCYRLPILTSRRCYLRGVFEELMWFIRGQTNSRTLEHKGIRVWQVCSTRGHLNSKNLPYKEGDVGPSYGFQWRHWGGDYRGCQDYHTGEGVDQLAEVIRLLRDDPYSKHIILSSWNVNDLDKMALIPCLIIYQFNVSGDGALDCCIYQRSSDFPQGNNWNVLSACLLMILLAQQTNLYPRRLTHFVASCHLHTHHRDIAIIQAQRTPRPYPIVQVSSRDNIEDYEWEDISVWGYAPHSKLEYPVSESSENDVA
jgi:thymidylate synthase